jgi:hypothetical protein
MAVTFPYVRAATWVDGSTTDTAAKRNTIEDGIFNAHQQPAVRVTHNTTQSITNNTDTALAFNTERFDQAGGASSTQHDTVTNNSRLTCRFAGIYQITGQVEWASSAAGARRIYLRVGGATIICRSPAVAGATDDVGRLTLSTLYSLAVNDFVELIVWQNSGGALNVASAANYSPDFMMVRVG